MIGDTGARRARVGGMVDAVILGAGKIRIIGADDDIAAETSAPRTAGVRHAVREWCG